MSLDSSRDKDIFNLLANSSLILPLSYGSWFFDSDEVFVSNKLKVLIEASNNILDPYDFVQLMQNMFGGFLKTAVEKVSSGASVRNEYSATIKTKLGQDFTLRLIFDTKKQFYVLIVDKQKEKIEQKNNDISVENIINPIPIYVWQKNRDLRITYCNKKYADALETTQEAVVANNLKLFNSSRKDTYIDQGIYSSKPRHFTEYAIVSGERRLLDITEFPFVGNAPSVGFAFDITEKEDLKKEYKTYKKQTEETMDTISVPIIIFDEKMVFVFANTAIKKLFGVEESYFCVERMFPEMFDLFYDKLLLIGTESFQDYKERAIRFFTDVIDSHHATVHLQNGKTLNVTVTPNHGGGLMFLFEDITDKIALEREVNSLYAVQKETLDQLKEGILVFGPDNRIKMTNPAVKKVWNKNDDANYINTHIRVFFEEAVDLFDSKTELELWILKLINMASQRVEFSDTINISSGKTIDYGYIPLPDSLHLVRFFDATDKSNLEKTIKEKTDIISQIDKLKSNLISNISYELSSPLNTIMGFSDILLNQYFGELNPRQTEYCKGITKSAARLIEVVEAIINLASIEAGQMKIKYNEVNLLNFINESMDLFKNRSESQNIAIKTDFQEKNFIVLFDDQSMRHVLFQIISKAVKLTPSGGSIDISVDISDSDYFSITVADSGLGLSEEELEKIRSMFSNETDSSKTDNSLEFGMLLASNIIRLHNGTMSIESKRNSGTSVKLTIPKQPFLQ